MSAKKSMDLPKRTALIVPIDKFRAVLSERISIGKNMSAMQVKDESQLKDLEKAYENWNDYNRELLKSSFNKPSNEYKSDYVSAGQMIGVSAVMRGTRLKPAQQRYKNVSERIEVKTTELESLRTKLDLIPIEGEDTKVKYADIGSDTDNGNTVFIIHGHNEEMKKAVQLFVNRAGLNDIILHEQPDKNRTIIEKLVEEGESASYVVALLSPDDIQADGTIRARQNVILEIGYFIGRLGRAKVRMLIKDKVEIPSDLQGILYEDFDQKGAWQIKLLKELKAAGLSVNSEAVVEKF